MAYLAVGIGGALGALLRYSFSMWGSAGHGVSPITLFINLIGSFLLAYILTRQTFIRNPFIKIGVTTGFLGGFTTFSTFSLEAFTLLQQQMFLEALLYILCSSVGCVFASLIGLRVAKRGQL